MGDYSIPAPIGGWNSRDSLDNMNPVDAVRLDNLIPQETSVDSRLGFTELTTGLSSSVETLATYFGDANGQELIACHDGKISAINTSTGTATVKDTHSTNNRFKTLNINDKLVMVNGARVPCTYDGTNIASLTITGKSSPEDFNGVMSFKGRAYYWEQDTNSFWHCAAGAHTGAVTEFPVDYVSQMGGGITEIVTWTRDSGSGMDDLFVILMNTGETLVYQGSDPGDASWSLIGRYVLGQPLTIRGSTNLASDRIIITRDGYINLSTALQQARLTEKNNVGEKIINSVKRSVNLYSDLFGWQVVFLPSQSLLMVNVPVSATTFRQHVMNTNTGAWCRFLGMNAVCWVEHANQPYFGTTDGKIMKAFDGYSDNGSTIRGKCIPAFTSLGAPAREKTVTVCTVTSNHNYPSYISVDAHKDFNIEISPTLKVPPENDGALWGATQWGLLYWGENNTTEFKGVKSYKIPIAQSGYSLTVKVRHQTKAQQIKYYSFKLKFKGGKA